MIDEWQIHTRNVKETLTPYKVARAVCLSSAMLFRGPARTKVDVFGQNVSGCMRPQSQLNAHMHSS